MKLLRKEAFLSPTGLFVGYLIAAAALVVGFTALFPGRVPLPVYGVSWRLFQGFERVIALFPALALSALVIPFGFPGAGSARGGDRGPQFLDRMRGPLLCAAAAAMINALLCFAVLPSVQSNLSHMRYRGRLYNLSIERARMAVKTGEWDEAARNLGLCESLWPGNASEDIEQLKQQTLEGREKERFREEDEREAARRKETAIVPEWKEAPDKAAGIVARQPVNELQALDMAEAALNEKRYFDAHWLATLAGRLAKDGSPEQAEAARKASSAWNGIESLVPSGREKEARAAFELKERGYTAMVAGEWIQAYYVFRELSQKTPFDPDVEKYLARSAAGCREIAFFTDEVDMSGSLVTDAIFSLPYRDPYAEADTMKNDSRRSVLRLDSLSTFPDYSWGRGLELVIWDGSKETAAKSFYAQLLPRTLGGRPMTAVKMLALDRETDRRYAPEFSGPPPSLVGEDQLLIDIPYEDFLLLADIRQGNLPLGNLFTAARRLENFGMPAESFQTEIIRRLGAPVFLLPLGVLALIIGWRFRAAKTPWVTGIPMLFVLPLVWNGVFALCQAALENIGLWIILGTSFFWALFTLIGAAAVLFIVSLILLALQRE